MGLRAARRRLNSAVLAAALAVVALGEASAWVIDQEPSLQDKARAGEPLVYPPAHPGRQPGEYVVHEFDGPCPAVPTSRSSGEDGKAVTCRTVDGANGPRARVIVDLGREIRMNGFLAAELVRAMEAIEPPNRDRLGSIAATTMLPAMPFQPPDTDGTEWTDVAFNIDGAITLQSAATGPTADRTRKLFKRLAKTMMLPAAAVVLAVALLWVGIRRIRERAEMM